MEYGQTNDREMLLSVMRVAKSIQSSGDKTRLLQSLAPRYLDNGDKPLVTSFYETALTIPSAGDLRNVLETATPYAARWAAQTLMLIEATKNIASSGDRAHVMITLARSGALTSKDARDAFFAAVATLPSDPDRARVLQAAVRY